MITAYATLFRKRSVVIGKREIMTFDIVVTVTDAGNPVINASVTVEYDTQSLSGVTDSNGQITFEDVTLKQSDVLKINVDVSEAFIPVLRITEDWEERFTVTLRITEDWEEQFTATLRITEDWEDVITAELRITEDWEEQFTATLRITEDWEITFICSLRITEDWEE